MDGKLRQLQLTELELLDEFVRVCEKHGLQYYLIGGTLLGAVRHRGFIPWDDDVDVAMPREDYDRFAQLCAGELAPRYFYQCPGTDPHYFLTYAKLRKNGTEVYEERFRGSKFHKGVFIDIFPLDLCPAPGPVCHFLFNVLAVMNYRGQVDSGEVYQPYREISGKIGYAVLRLFSPKGLVKLRKRLLWLARAVGGKKYLAWYGGAYGYRKLVFPADWFGAGADLIFEQRSYTSPIRYENLLEKVYGDYMAEPPEDQRRRHITIEAEGEDGWAAEGAERAPEN